MILRMESCIGKSGLLVSLQPVRWIVSLYHPKSLVCAYPIQASRYMPH
ncbi:hypothetical protein BMETH_2842_0 [methanotrophic bacterial endosymbiont of Bathymodiolus sp.]|nr:hypothetical protein BMETH_2842_0 [methanotrophic bacterial endosymbiont of Bathymodiolus sp.]